MSNHVLNIHQWNSEVDLYSNPRTQERKLLRVSVIGKFSAKTLYRPSFLRSSGGVSTVGNHGKTSAERLRNPEMDMGLWTLAKLIRLLTTCDINYCLVKYLNHRKVIENVSKTQKG